jgi:phosphoglucosamine mutase
VLTKSPQIQRNLRVKKKPELQEMKAAAKVAEIEREIGDGGRVLIRYSGTEPLLRILVEGRDTEQIKRKINELAAAIEEEIGV